MTRRGRCRRRPTRSADFRSDLAGAVWVARALAVSLAVVFAAFLSLPTPPAHNDDFGSFRSPDQYSREMAQHDSLIPRMAFSRQYRRRYQLDLRADKTGWAEGRWSADGIYVGPKHAGGSPTSSTEETSE